MTPDTKTSSDPVLLAYEAYGQPGLKYLAKSNPDFRRAAREMDRDAIWLAFGASTQSETAAKAARAMDVSERTIINWMQCQNDMPSWALRIVKAYLAALERAAQRIEGRDE